MRLSFRQDLGGLNGVCPYFTMFPLSFPLAVLSTRAARSDWVLDPFCGRGTTNLAARGLGLGSIGIDSHPLAAAISEAKLLSVLPAHIVRECEDILSSQSGPRQPPEGRFWQLAYHQEVLDDLCRLREALLEDCESPVRKALRAVLLGALHGPLTKLTPSHLSNQCPRTYAPKPDYAVRYWETRGLTPPRVDIGAVVEKRAQRFFNARARAGGGEVVLGDARLPESFVGAPKDVKWFITSPPYYGLRTYLPDQWLRLWFLGGAARVKYAQTDQVSHHSPGEFANDLHRVWRNCATTASSDATLVIRFGGIHDRAADPWSVLRLSLEDTGWRVVTRVSAGTSRRGRRQADSFARERREPKGEFDVWARKA